MEGFDGLLLGFDGGRDIAHFQSLGGLLGGLLGVVFLELAGLLSHFLLQFLQVGDRVLHRLVAVHRLVAELLLGLLRVRLGRLGLLDGLGDLVGGVHRRDLHGLQLRLVVGLLPLLIGEGLGHFLLCVLQILGGFLPFLRGGVELFVVEILLGHVHLFSGHLHFLGRLGDGVLQLRADLFRFRLQIPLLFGQILGVVLLAGLVHVGGLVGDGVLLLGQFAELRLGVFQLGDVVATLFDVLGLVLQSLLRDL